MIRPFVFSAFAAVAAVAAEVPPPAQRAVDFTKDIQPILMASCTNCHARGKSKGDYSIETRAAFLKGGKTEVAAEPGKSAESYLVELIAGVDPSNVMPQKGKKLTAEQVGLVRAWIDQGAKWPDGVSFARPAPRNLVPRTVSLPDAPSVQSLDRLVGRYFAGEKVGFPAPVGDATFARRAYLDVIGLLPTAAQLDAFERDAAPDKRAKLVDVLLSDNRAYAEHWLTFWSDLLRNDYKGTGFIDGGRKQITGWLFTALATNIGYDKFVRELVHPSRATEGFTAGIIWRGNVNASMLPPMQAAQNVAQVFMGVNLKCSSCHDSFVSDWTLADSYGLAAVFAEKPMELIECDKPTGERSAVRFLYPEIGAIDAAAPLAARTERLGALLTDKKNDRLAKTLVNRLWSRLFGRGLVEPLDDMEKPAWSADILDWLAQDFVAHGYDIKHTLRTILTSHAYALPTVEGAATDKNFVFRGPLTRRLSAEQFSDAVSSFSGDWERLPGTLEFDFAAAKTVEGVTLPTWIWTNETASDGVRRGALAAIEARRTAAKTKLAEQAKKADAIDPATSADAATAATAELEKATAAVRETEAAIEAAQQVKATGEPGQIIARPGSDQHAVVFTRKFDLAAVPDDAVAAVLATQSWDVFVNGKEAKHRMANGFLNGRVRLYEIKPLLRAGQNTVTVGVQSLTSKAMNSTEAGQFKSSLGHENKAPGFAFSLQLASKNAAPLQISSDTAWRVRRNPGGNWKADNLDSADWAAAVPVAPGVEPTDEGPGLEPIRREDFANKPARLGQALSPAVSTAALVARGTPVRAALRPADALQVALDRPNREVVLPARPIAATTLQALELTNGNTLDAALKDAAARLLDAAGKNPEKWLHDFYRHALARDPSPAERTAALDFLGKKPDATHLADLLWVVAMSPEFQLIN